MTLKWVVLFFLIVHVATGNKQLPHMRYLSALLSVQPLCGWEHVDLGAIWRRLNVCLLFFIHMFGTYEHSFFFSCCLWQFLTVFLTFILFSNVTVTFHSWALLYHRATTAPPASGALHHLQTGVVPTHSDKWSTTFNLTFSISVWDPHVFTRPCILMCSYGHVWAVTS